MAHDVFISHSSKDKVYADAICATLEKHNVRCWVAPRDILPGSDYGAAIVESIKASKVMILIFSSNSNESTHVKREVERAVNHGIIIVPFKIEDVVLSSTIEYFVSGTHWLDAIDPPFENHLKSITEYVCVLLKKPTPIFETITDQSFINENNLQENLNLDDIKDSINITDLAGEIPAKENPIKYKYKYIDRVLDFLYALIIYLVTIFFTLINAFFVIGAITARGGRYNHVDILFCSTLSILAYCVNFLSKKNLRILEG